MTYKEKLDLYNKAKDAYYNGQEIMSDIEFDNLEKELGLENKSTVGSKHNPAYTIKHPYVMGSLSKVQIHKDKDGNIDWKKYRHEICKYLSEDTIHNLIITPKYDGCSFEISVETNINSKGTSIATRGKTVSISSRGDGTYGKDLYKHLINKIPYKLLMLNDTFTLRGEVLVDKNIFLKKYAEQFTNPRSFVSSVLNSDYSDDAEFQDKLKDIDIVIYDYKVNTYGTWEDLDWTEIIHKMKRESIYDEQAVKEIMNILPDKYIYDTSLYLDNDLINIYNTFAEYRNNCKYALDGIVVKPVDRFRMLNLHDHRPKDCVAIKFIPMLQETEVIDITWNLGKTHEFIPIIWVNPVEMDGRMVKKCSGHNLGYLREKGITVGAKIIMSLAGDIIPFMYKVTQPNKNGEIPMPKTYGYYEDDIHLMALMEEKDRTRMLFLASAKTLNIPTIGTETAKNIWNNLDNEDNQVLEFFGEEKKKMPFNILLCSAEDIYFGAGAGKLGTNAKKAFEDIRNNITLTDIIRSCNFPFCGHRMSEQITNYFLNITPDWSHLATEGYLWVYDTNSWQYKQLMDILNHFGKTFDDFKEQHIEETKTVSDQIPVILTGEPNNYATKAEFLKLNPQYRLTSSWKEVQIVFTNSLESNTGKMKKARDKGIKLELY